MHTWEQNRVTTLTSPVNQGRMRKGKRDGEREDVENWQSLTVCIVFSLWPRKRAINLRIMYANIHSYNPSVKC